ncbi:MAG: T9SS type A sorting domain-containing protein [Bacteroidota bacterium]
MRIVFIFLIPLWFLASKVKAQSLERKVFSNGGGQATIGPHTYTYTFGEPLIGTITTPNLILTKGFNQPLDISVLPLSLFGPQVQAFGEGVSLHWQSNLAQGEGELILERSLDGQNFSDIYTTESKGIDGANQAYDYFDRTVLQEAVSVVWYRVLIQTYDGQYRQSEMVSVRLVAKPERLWEVFPNPNNGTFQIRAYIEQESQIRVYLLNSLGQPIWQNQSQMAVGLFEQRIQLQSIPSGHYFLVMQTPKRQWRQILVIQ